jgi:hypothetical protein
MNMYWLYELPNWLFGVLTIAVTAAVGLSGLHTTRRWVRRVHGDRHSHNEVVGYYLSAVRVFYGITLGLTRLRNCGEGGYKVYRGSCRTTMDRRVGWSVS